MELFPRIAILLLFSLLCGSDSKKIKEKHRSSRPHDDHHSSEDVPSPHEQRQLSLVVEHAFGKEPFSKRGTVLLRSLKSSRDVNFHQEPLTAAQVKSIQKAAAAGDLYFIRTGTSLSSSIDDEQSSAENVTTVSTFISACALIKSNFNDRIVVNGDGKGNVYGLTLLPAVSVLDDDDLECSSFRTTSSSSSVPFTTTITYSTGETGPAPDTQGFIQKEEAEKAKMETEDNRSFFQKYWLYILIGFVAFQFLVGSGGAAGGGAGGGGGGGQ